MRVLILTAPVGEGHVAAARALSNDILQRGDGAEVIVCDVLPALGRPLRWLLSDAYRWQLRTAPWLFGLLFGALHRSRLLRWCARAGLSLAGSRALLRLVRRHPADVIVSTWPSVTPILGSLRTRGKLRVPVCASITDFAGLELWADKGVDLHLVMHERLVAEVERLAGPGSARFVAPPVSSPFFTARSAGEARRALRLPSEGTIVLISGGGWGVGDLFGAVTTALELEGASIICLAGRDATVQAQLAAAFAREPRVTVLGFTDQMSDLLAAADVLVHSTGGVTCLEALVRGCPIVAYGAPPGHAPLLARKMAALGLVEHARSDGELRAALQAAGRRQHPASLAGGVDAATLVLGAIPRIAVRTRARLARATATAAALAAVLFVLLASDATYPVVAEALTLPETTSVSNDKHAIALVIRGQRRDLLSFAPIARRDHLRISVAVSGPPLTTRDVVALRGAGLEPIPALQAGGVGSWLHVRGDLRSQIARYGLRASFYYLAPREGFTILDYLLARHLGGLPIQVSDDLANSAGDIRSIHPGEIVLATLGPMRGHARGQVLTSIRRLERLGVTVSSVQRLAAAER